MTGVVSAMEPPLVSLIVRSVGRRELGDALAAVAAQDHPALEAIVVDATGGRHSAVATRAGAFPVRFVEGIAPRPRPEAANAGLDAAEGALLGFLDDDDLIEPTHVSGLVAALGAAPEAVAAYSSAREIDARGAVVAWRAQDYSRLLLYHDCYLVSNSVLFRREALSRCRFDARFEICQDWDFWLQLSELGDFVHVEAETAIVRTTLGGSGTGRGANRDRARYERYRSLLAEKWSARGAELAAGLDAEAEHALALLSAQRIDDAEAAADRVLKAFPFHVAALNAKGVAVASRGNATAAVPFFRAAVAEDGADAGSRLNLARALERCGRPAEAAAEYRALLARMPDHPAGRERLASLESSMKTSRS